MSERHETEPVAHADEQTAGLPVLPPLTAMMEIAILVVLPGLCDLLLPAFPSLNEMQPHFFWLPVLLLTLQYGSASGLLAAGTAIILASLLGWPEQEIGENHFSYLLRIWLQPVLWLATAVILGQLRLRQIERKQTLGRAVAELTSQRHALAEHAQSLRERCDRLERIVAVQRRPDARELLAALGRIGAGDAAQSAGAMAEVLNLGFGQAAISVFALDAGVLRLAHRHAPPGAPPSPATIDAASRLHSALVCDGRAASVLDPHAEHDLEGYGLAAVPILGAAGHVEGAVLFETGAAGDLDPSTTDRLRAIAALLAGRVHQPGLIAPQPATTAAGVNPRAGKRESHSHQARGQLARQRAGIPRSARKAGP